MPEPSSHQLVVYSLGSEEYARAVRPRGRGAPGRGLAMLGAVADRQRVVVADDSRLMRRMLADALGRQGFDVVATAGGRVLAEDESSCTIYGMPRAVAEARLAHQVLPLSELAPAIAREAA